MTTEQRIKAIHGEFNTASEKILIMVKQLQSNINVGKASRLFKAGFINAKESIALADIDTNLCCLIEYYQQEYPNNKFITEKMVVAVCSKYKLVCAPVDKYIGFVPEKNLNQIEAFKVKNQDKAPDEMIITSAWNTGAGNDYSFRSKGAAYIHNNIGLDKIPLDHPSIEYMRGEPFSYRGGGYIEKYTKIDRQSLMICAPKKDFKLNGVKRFGFMFSSFIEVTVPDPIVLKPVRGGYLIVTAWGDEASDENIVNEKMN
jgi:hypothetical protein